MRTIFILLCFLVIFPGGISAQVVFIDMADSLHITELDFGIGVGIVDLNNDFVSEIILANSEGADRLYVWQDGFYAELGEEYGLSQNTDYHHGLSLTDLDKDNLPDFYINGDPNYQHGHLYLNMGSPPFQDVAEQYNLSVTNDMGSAFFQFNSTSELAVLRGRNLLVREGQTFVDITQGSGFETIDNVFEPMFFDIDNDNDVDLFVAGNWSSHSGRLFRNNGDTTFTDISTNTNQGGFPLGQGVCIGDIDNDGDFDLYLIAGGSNSNTMWQNDGTGYFTNVTASSNTGYGGYTRGSNFGDFDNDGDIDIFLNRGDDYNMLLLNNGAGVFADFSNYAGVMDNLNGCGSAVGDLNNDGQLDIVATNYSFQPTQVYINQNQNPNFIKLKIIGLYPNTLALGAIIDLYGIEDDQSDTLYLGRRQIASQSSMLSFDDPIVHFGTGNYNRLLINVSFMSGNQVDTSGFLVGETIIIVEDSLFTSIGDDIMELPENYLILKTYPNPFNAQTTIKYYIPIAGHVSIEIYDLLGRKIETIVDEERQAGWHQAVWDASDHSSGVYFYRIEAGDFTKTKKMILLR